MRAYKPRSDRSRWMRDQIVAALRVHGQLTRVELAVSIGCSAYDLTGPMYAMFHADELTRFRASTAPGSVCLWSLGSNAPAAVDVEALEPFPMSGEPLPPDQ